MPTATPMLLALATLTSRRVSTGSAALVLPPLVDNSMFASQGSDATATNDNDSCSSSSDSDDEDDRTWRLTRALILQSSPAVATVSRQHDSRDGMRIDYILDVSVSATADTRACYVLIPKHKHSNGTTACVATPKRQPRHVETKPRKVARATSNRRHTATRGCDTAAAALAGTSVTPHDPSTQCRYRKGCCRKPRLLKQNGVLHTLCKIHRARSIANQKPFDFNKRQESKRLLQMQERSSNHIEQ